ncbi:MAG: Spy/CpxP family protein refolding chaperone [Cyanobacteria bacterium P01_H01_bin.119]
MKLFLRASLLINAGLLTAVVCMVAKPTLNASATATGLQWLQGTTDGASGLKQESDRSGVDFLCHPRRDDYIEAGARFLELQLDLAETQATLLDSVKNTLKTSTRDSLTSLCADLTTNAVTSAPDKLTQYQDLALAADAIFSDVRPAFEGFYGSLSNTQQQRLDDIFTRE